MKYDIYCPRASFSLYSLPAQNPVNQGSTWKRWEQVSTLLDVSQAQRMIEEDHILFWRVSCGCRSFKIHLGRGGARKSSFVADMIASHLAKDQRIWDTTLLTQPFSPVQGKVNFPANQSQRSLYRSLPSLRRRKRNEKEGEWAKEAPLFLRYPWIGEMI